MHIKIYSNDPDLSVCKYYVSENTNELSALEEALYVLWELTPTERGWKTELRDKHGTWFDYHSVSSSLVINTTEHEYIIMHFGD